LHDRLVSSAGHGVRVRRLGGNRAGEIRLTRFLRNARVRPQEMVSSAAERLGGRCADRHVLAIQDTTVVKSEGGGGLYLHACVAVDADDGAILGLAHAQFLKREAGRKALRRHLPTAGKESQRWLDGADHAARACAAARQLTIVADRESDIYAAFARCPAGAHMIVRAAQDRSLDDGGLLFGKVDARPEAGRTSLELPAKPGRAARKATLAVRLAGVDLKRPRNSVDKDLPDTLSLYVVDVREVDAGAGECVHWRLLTTCPVADIREALVVADLYRRRWAIEQLFRTMKTQGFDIEGLRIEEDAPRCKLVMAALIAAVTVQQLVHARDGADARGRLRPILDAFGEDDIPLMEALCAKLEGKTERQKNPHPKRSLAYASWVCARLGGWTGYYGKPGPIVMLEGWFEFQAAKRGVLAISQQRNM
jgi:Transposase DDE domain